VVFKDTSSSTTYTLSLHDALPIFPKWRSVSCRMICPVHTSFMKGNTTRSARQTGMRTAGQNGTTHPPLTIHGWEVVPDVPCVLRSEEHTSELQSRFDLVCRLLLAK